MPHLGALWFRTGHELKLPFSGQFSQSAGKIVIVTVDVCADLEQAQTWL
jgi:hypothetical protein